MSISIPVVLDTAALPSQLAELERKSKDAGKAIGDSIGAGAKKAERSAGEAAKGLEDLGDAAGLPVDKLKKLAGGFSALSNPVTLAIVGIGSVALGAVAAATGIIQATIAAKALAEELKPLRGQEGFGISDSALASITRAVDGLSAVGAVVKQLVVGMGAEFAPTVERVSVLLVKLGLMALDAFNTFASGHDVMRDLAVFLVDGLIGAMTGVVTSLMNVLNAMADVARAAGQSGLAGKLEGVTRRWSDFKTELADDVVGALGKSFVRAEAATGDYDERAKKLIGSMKLLGQAHKDVKAAVDELSLGVEEQLQGWSAGMGLVGDELVLVKQEVDAAVDAGMAGLGGMTDQALELTLGLDGAADAASDLGDAFADKVVNATSAVQGGLEGIATLIGGPVAGAITGLILNLESTVAGIIEQLKSLPGIVRALPSLIVSLVETLLADVVPALLLAIPDLVAGLLQAVPAILRGVIKALPLIITALAFLMPDVVQAVILSLPDIILALLTLIPLLIGGLMTGFRDAFKFAWEWLLNDGIKELGRSLVQVFKDAWQALQDALGGLFGGESRRNNDAPSMQRAGPRGANVGVGAGDYFLAGRNPQALLEQALNGALGAGAAPVMAGGGGQINMAYQHRAFDGFFVRHAQLGGQTSGLFKTMNTSKDARGM